MKIDRFCLRTSGLCCLAFITMIGIAPMAIAKPSVRPRVLVDRSHEWLFAYDDLGDRMLQPAGYDVVLCDASLDTKQKLNDFDIVMVLQIANAFEYSTAEVALLQEYVREGGSLLVVGRPGLPVANVAASFGFRMTQERCVLPFVATTRLRIAGGNDSDPRTRPMSYAVRPPQDAEVLITDQRRRMIAAIAYYGRGKVICFADDGAYWISVLSGTKNCACPTPRQRFPSSNASQAHRPPAGHGAPVQRFTAEQEISSPGITVRYSTPVAMHAKQLLNQIPMIAELVASYNGTKRPAGTLVVNVLAASGGGYSGGKEIGVQCAGAMGDNVKVIAHEMTHSWTGPLPGLIGEGWASMVGMRVAADLGYQRAAWSEWDHWKSLLNRAEAGSQRLDLTEPETNPSLFGACEAKMMSLVLELENRYGKDFMTRFLRITRALKGNENPTLNEVLYYFSLAADEDLAPLYRQLHVAYTPPHSTITKEELARKLEAYSSP